MEMDRGSGEKSEEKDSEDEKNSSQNSWWGTWGQDWIATVKEKSSVTLNMVKKDLNEFVEVIQGDTAEKLSETASKLENENENERESNQEKKDEGMEATAKVVKQGLSKILHSVSELISIEPDDSTDEVITLGDEKSFSSNYDRKQEKLHFIQTNPGTYCNEPEGAFDDWLETFTLEDLKQEMSDLLVQNPLVRAIYTQLVEERKRKEILERANQMNLKEEEEVDDEGWGDEDDIENPCEETDANNIEVSRLNTHNITQNNVDKFTEKSPLKENKTCEVSGTELNETDKTVVKSEDIEPKVTDNVETPCGNDTKLKNSISPEPLNKSHETINSDCGISTDQKLNELKKNDSKKLSPKSSVKVEPVQQAVKNLKIDQSDDKSSLSSWMSIDDDIRVKKTLGEVIVKSDSKENSEGKNSDGSSAVLVNKSDADDLDDFDLDLEDDVNDEELQKMVQDIKNKSSLGNLQDDEDDDWENWE